MGQGAWEGFEPVGFIYLRCFFDEVDRRKKDLNPDTGEPKLPPPEVLYIQCDNAGNNKNKQLYRIAEMLVKIGAVRTSEGQNFVLACQPQCRHTHEDVDACFGAGSHLLSRKDAFTLDDVGLLWKRAWPSTKSFQYVSVSIFWYNCIFLFKPSSVSKLFLQEKVDWIKYFAGNENRKFTGVYCPCVVVWKKSEIEEGEFQFGWKCNM
jgi:hypothetical protein